MKENTNKWPKAAPRIALSPDGKDLIIYDQNGNILEKQKGITQEEYIEAVKGKEFLGKKTVTLEARMGNPVCQIWVLIGSRWYCYKVDCATGAYKGMC
jgi:hypothetical protein